MCRFPDEIASRIATIQAQLQSITNDSLFPACEKEKLYARLKELQSLKAMQEKENVKSTFKEEL